MAKIKLSTVKKRLWKLVSLYIRQKYADPHTGICKCSTCDTWLPWKEMQAGHFVPKSHGNAVYFVEENIHPQCPRCNMYEGGNIPAYFRFMEDTYGREKIDELFDLAQTTLKLTVNDLLEMEAEFKELLKNLEMSKGDDYLRDLKRKLKPVVDNLKGE